MMGTKIFQGSTDEEYKKALGQFFAVSLPLCFGTILLWYLLKERYKRANAKRSKSKL